MRASPKARLQSVGFVIPSIPAHAGKTSVVSVGSQFQHFNPRACGEDASIAACSTARILQSPRMRGRRCAFCTGFFIQPSIPACAGKTMSIFSKRQPAAFNPRVRGEDVLNFPPALMPTLQSPRARGRRARFAPSLRSVTFNPRVRGEDIAGATGSGKSLLQSPRARGRPRCRESCHCLHPSIPACAGKTARETEVLGALAFNPRVRGEDRVAPSLSAARALQSPRARGRPSRRAARRARGPSIPACAGKTKRDQQQAIVVGYFVATLSFCSKGHAEFVPGGEDQGRRLR